MTFFQIFTQLSEGLGFVVWVGRFANGKLKSCPNVLEAPSLPIFHANVG